MCVCFAPKQYASYWWGRGDSSSSSFTFYTHISSLRTRTGYLTIIISKLWFVTIVIEIWPACPGEDEERERDRKVQQEIKISLLWCLCHHHKWSFRQNSICLALFREGEVEREKKPQKNIPRTFDTEMRDQPFTNLAANSCW